MKKAIGVHRQNINKHIRIVVSKDVYQIVLFYMHYKLVSFFKRPLFIYIYTVLFILFVQIL